MKYFLTKKVLQEIYCILKTLIYISILFMTNEKHSLFTRQYDFHFGGRLMLLHE